MSVTVKPIRPKKFGRLGSSYFQSEIEKTLDEIQRETVKLYQQVTSTWSGGVDIQESKSPFRRTVVVNDKRFKFVDKGTRAHWIVAKTKKKLRFQTDYSAKTRPGSLSSVSGGASGPTVHRTRVWHPGTEARNFTEEIQQQADRISADRMNAMFKKRFGG